LQQIRNHPLSVLLLDEIEKASPDVFDVLLSLLDEGRLTDRFGLTTSFRSCVVIMTSNVGVRRGSSLGFSELMDVDYGAEVRRAFRPEFFNRLDHVIPFSALSYDVIVSIAAKELGELGEREGLQRRHIRLDWTDRVLGKIARVGFHPELGARPLQKAIELTVVAPLSRWLIDHPAASQCRLLLDMEEDQLVIVMD
jgi:ATP-dependent Clp protease ATP-binding subunit ClpC